MKLIDKDALLAIIKEKVDSLLENNQRLYDEYGNYFYKNIDNDYRFYHKIDDFEWDEDKLSLSDVVGYIFPIDTIEIKEVDLSKEIDNEWNKCEPIDEGMGLEIASIEHEQFDKIAKHFFELGMRVSNPITAADRGTAEEIIVNLKRVEKDYRIDLTKEMKWLRDKVKKGE